MWLHAISALAILSLFAISYDDVLRWLYGRYVSEDSYYSHGFLIPLVSLFIVWRNRDRFKRSSTEEDFSSLGLVIFIAGAGFHLVGKVLYIYSLSGFSILFLALGMAIFIFGKQNSRVLLFPIVYLVFMFPLPTAAINAIAFPLKMLVAKVGVDVIRLLGIPIYREGFDIAIPAGNLLVGNPCSGLRSLIAFLALGSVYAYMSDLTVRRKWVFFTLSIPIAVLCNIVRVPILILISHYWGLAGGSPESIWHDASGVFMFVMGLILMYNTGNLMRCRTSGIAT